MQNNNSVINIDINLIIPNKYQPRKVFDDESLDSLAESIKIYGILNPILVRSIEDKYEIIAGERRYRAAKKIGLTQVPVIIKDSSEQQLAELALIENIQRQNLSPIEEAKSYEDIMKLGNLSQSELAIKLGKSQGNVANKMRLLTLPEEIQDALANKKISERHARSLLTIPEREKKLELLDRIINEKLTVKETEQIINSDKINAEEIQQAISDIMKSLNISEENEEKEEKEDDNMNNGNFFPNYDNNTMNNNTSLNMMNMQSINTPPIEPAPETVMPTTMPAPELTPSPVTVENLINPIPSFEQPVQPQPISQPEMQPGSQPSVTTSFDPMEQFMNSVSQPNNMMTNQQVSIQPEVSISDFTPTPPTPQPENVYTTPMIDEPLFNQNAVMPNQVPQVEPQQPTKSEFEITLSNDEPVVEIKVDKLTELQNLLSSNGYNFKIYSNDTENCVIIELPKN